MTGVSPEVRGGSPVVHSEHTFWASWRQPADVDRYLRERCEGRVANICCGQSPLGDIRVDADPAHNPDLVADMRSLPLGDASFDTVVFDPPWKLGYYERMRPFFECLRILRPDGLLLMNALWMADSEQTTLEGPPIIRADDRWANISVIVPHRKHPGQQTLATYDPATNPETPEVSR